MMKIKRDIDENDEATEIDMEEELYNYVNENPDDPFGWFNLGAVYASKNKDNEAIEAYNKAIGLDPNYYQAINNLALLIEKSGDLQKAKELYEQAVKIYQQDSLIWQNLGVCCIKMKDYTQAKEAFQRAIECNIDNGLAHYYMGFIEEHNENLKEAEKYYRKAIEIDPTYKEAWNNLLMVLTKLGKTEEAEKILNKMKELPNI